MLDAIGNKVHDASRIHHGVKALVSQAMLDFGRGTLDAILGRHIDRDGLHPAGRVGDEAFQRVCLAADGGEDGGYLCRRAGNQGGANAEAQAPGCPSDKIRCLAGVTVFVSVSEMGPCVR